MQSLFSRQKDQVTHPFCFYTAAVEYYKVKPNGSQTLVLSLLIFHCACVLVTTKFPWRIQSILKFNFQCASFAHRAQQPKLCTSITSYYYQIDSQSSVQSTHLVHILPPNIVSIRGKFQLQKRRVWNSIGSWLPTAAWKKTLLICWVDKEKSQICRRPRVG